MRDELETIIGEFMSEVREAKSGKPDFIFNVSDDRFAKANCLNKARELRELGKRVWVMRYPHGWDEHNDASVRFLLFSRTVSA